MTEPGWYVDYENPQRMRYHDGQAWTEHVHADHADHAEDAEVAAAPVEPVVPSAMQQDAIAGDEAPQDPAWLRAILYPFVGIVGGLMIGGLLFNAAGAITPVTETTGTVRQIEIDLSSGGDTTNRISHVISGTTVDGDDWQIIDENAYNVLKSEGYPQPVTLAIGDWTGTPERVTGASFEVDHQTTGARVLWGTMLAISALIGAVAIWMIARNTSGGVVPAALFGFFLLGPGCWLGYQAFQWIQSG